MASPTWRKPKRENNLRRHVKASVAEIIASGEPEREPGTPPSPTSQGSDDVARLRATECVDELFRMVQLNLLNSKRWARLFLTVAKRQEVRLDRLREAMYVAVALDDIHEVRELKALVPPHLWAFWGYHLDLVARAQSRCRPGLIGVLPKLTGDAYMEHEDVDAQREALDARPALGSAAHIFQKQRGEVLIGIVRRPFEKMTTIPIKELTRQLHCIEAGEWQDSFMPAHGVNYGPSVGDYAGWRPLHFVAANPSGGTTALAALARLLEAKADPLLPDANGSSPLHTAALRNHPAAADVLLEAGAAVEAQDIYGLTALLQAARVREAEMVRRIVKWVLPSDALELIFDTEPERDSQQYSLPNGVLMQTGVAKGNFDIVRKLVLKGDGTGNELANVNAPDALGRRAVHMAAGNVSSEEKACEILQGLCKYRADVDARDLENRETALHVAARLGRAKVVRTLLRLKSHPGLVDSRGRTPLMLAARKPDQHREMPPYDGILLRRAINWNTIREVVEWDGVGSVEAKVEKLWSRVRNLLGDDPGPAPRKVKGDAKDFVDSLFNRTLIDDLPPRKEKKKKEAAEEDEGDEEDEADEDEAASKPPAPPGKSLFAVGAQAAATANQVFLARRESAQRRADVLIKLGFDDQHILDAHGRINRGERLQLFSSLYQRERRAPPSAPLLPVQKRLRAVFRKLLAPLLRAEATKSLTPRFSEFLQYLKLSMYGVQGQTLIELITAAVGTRLKYLPTWEDIEEVLQLEDLGERAALLEEVSFRGAKPWRQKWVGSVWASDEYPREPEFAPWGAFEYVDQETADVINTRGGKPAPTLEAFKGNNFRPIDHSFNFGVLSNDKPPPHRGDLFQLANRLLVNEASGQLNTTDDDCWDRSLLVGNRLLCPLLTEALEGLRGGEALEAATEHRELLQYVAAQMAPLEKILRSPRLAYKEAWADVRLLALRVFAEEVTVDVPPLDLPPECLPEGLDVEAALEGSQTGCMPQSDVKWMRRRHSSRAYVELVRAGGITCAADFCEIIVALAANVAAQESLAECFWRAAFALLLWGRAQLLLPVFEKALRSRLPQNGVQLHGPFLKSRPQLLDAVVKAGSANTVYLAAPTAADEASPPAYPVPGGFSDVLRAVLVCENEEAMQGILLTLLARPPDLVAAAREPRKGPKQRNPPGVPLEFIPVRAVSDFDGERRTTVLPLAAGVVIVFLLGSSDMVHGEPLRQMVEVEVLLTTTLDARWLADTIGITVSDIPSLAARARKKKRKSRRAESS